MSGFLYITEFADIVTLAARSIGATATVYDSFEFKEPR